MAARNSFRTAIKFFTCKVKSVEFITGEHDRKYAVLGVLIHLEHIVSRHDQDDEHQDRRRDEILPLLFVDEQPEAFPQVYADLTEPGDPIFLHVHSLPSQTAE